VFFSSHVLSEVERVCDRVGIIRDGELVAVEPTHRLVDKAFRHVTLTFDAPVDDRPFAALPGVEGLKADGARLSFNLYSEPDAMVKLAARHRLVGMEYERPSLEEIFLTYYGPHGGEG
jgi:ABC-2 type transport system ATP-binding protein